MPFFKFKPANWENIRGVHRESKLVLLESNREVVDDVVSPFVFVCRRTWHSAENGRSVRLHRQKTWSGEGGSNSASKVEDMKAAKLPQGPSRDPRSWKKR